MQKVMSPKVFYDMIIVKKPQWNLHAYLAQSSQSIAPWTARSLPHLFLNSLTHFTHSSSEPPTTQEPTNTANYNQLSNISLNNSDRL